MTVKESHTTGFPKYRYYLIRNGREHLPMSEGETAAQAWKNAVHVALERARKAIVEIEDKKL